MFKIYRIHKLSLAMQLKSMGHEILDKFKNDNNRYYTYIFQDTEQFRDDLTAITSK